jgi:hypothetical protein
MSKNPSYTILANHSSSTATLSGFNVTMGNFEGTEICDLAKEFGNKFVDLYCDETYAPYKKRVFVHP